MAERVQLHVCLPCAEPLTDVERVYLPRLHAQEQARYAALTSEKRRREWLVARALALEALQRAQGEVDAPALRTREQGGIEYRESPGFHLSISHSRGLVAVALAAVPVGVDLEHVHARPMIAEAERFFAPTEAAHLVSLPDPDRQALFYDYWTLKEAACKAAGLPLWQGLDRLKFDLRDRKTPAFSTAAQTTGAGWRFWLANLAKDWRLAVAAHSDLGPYALEAREFFLGGGARPATLEGLLSFAA